MRQQGPLKRFFSGTGSAVCHEWAHEKVLFRIQMKFQVIFDERTSQIGVLRNICVSQKPLSNSKLLQGCVHIQVQNLGF